MQLFVRAQDGTNRVLECDPTDTIADLKMELAGAGGVSSLMLTSNSRVLRDENNLMQSGLHGGATIEASLRVRGGDETVTIETDSCLCSLLCCCCRMCCNIGVGGYQSQQ
eukprot:TRINITY_DN14651_c0_g1_i1.p2 TRINITY_DN14651_c0_g1~~TRINITY_DN14651_c0_g1_i1.p2  ORF type:complete len:110 (+),score=23.84 TRINITY_DN14651_c0_g1_i1:46-375(+)